MSITFINSFQSEWLKKKRTAAAWLVVIGAIFIPVVMLAVQFMNYQTLPGQLNAPGFWEKFFMRCWESMALFLLPMGIVLSTSLITQLEFRNNTWKQLHTTPQQYSTIFIVKLLVILVMVIEFFLLFNAGIYLAGIMPALLFKHVPFPSESFPWLFFLKTNLQFFVNCLPIIAVQYLIGLRYKNFLVPIGTGLILIVATMFALHWKYGYLLPYTYCGFGYLRLISESKALPGIHISLLAFCSFCFFTGLSYILYITKKEKG